MSISSCPQCGKQVTIPAGVGTNATVRCPLCHSQYALADALVNMPPLLELIAEEATDQIAAAPVAPPEADIGEPVAEDAPPEALALGQPPGQDDLRVEENDTEIEELAVSGSEQVREVTEDLDPIEVAGGEEESALDLDEQPAPPEAAAESDDAGTPVDEELELEFDQAASGDESEQEAEIQFEDESAPAEAAESEDLVFDLEEGEGGGQPGTEQLADLSASAEVSSEPVEGETLDFGDSIEMEEQPVPVAAVASADEAEPEDDGKKGKKKKKKEKKQKKAKADAAGEPRRRLSTVMSVALGAVIALPVATYGVLWLGPAYDFLGLGPRLHGWGVPVPASYGRSTRVAVRPTQSSGPLQDTVSQPDDAAQPPTFLDDTGTPEADPATEPAVDTALPEMPEQPAADEPPSSLPDAADASSDAPPPALPAAEPAAPAPADEPSTDPIDDLFPAAETPQETPTEPAEPTVTDAPPADEAPLADDPFAETATPDASDDLPGPLDEAMPDQEPSEPLGPVNAVQVSMADLAKAIAVAQVADQQMAAVGPTTPQDEVKRRRSDFYLSFFRLADALTFANDDAGSGELDAMRQQLDEFIRRFAADGKRVNALKYNAGRWLGFSRRTTPGIMLAGTVQSAEPVGRMHEIKLGIGLESDAPIVTVLVVDDPGVVAGDEAVVLGTIVENPAENVAGYEGSEPTAVWNGMLVKLSTGP